MDLGESDVKHPHCGGHFAGWISLSNGKISVRPSKRQGFPSIWEGRFSAKDTSGKNGANDILPWLVVGKLVDPQLPEHEAVFLAAVSAL